MAGAYADWAAQTLQKGEGGEKAVATIAQHALWVVELEACSEGQIQQVLADIVWLTWSTTRLLMFLAHDDYNNHKSKRCQDVAMSNVGRLPDERVPEDIHQKVRDFQRSVRKNAVSCSQVYGTAVSSGLLEKRKVKMPEIPNAEITEARFKRKCGKQTHEERKPKEWPKSWNKLMDPRKTWQSLSPQVLLSSCLSWQALCLHMESGRKASLGNSWWCRLLKPTDLYEHVPSGTLWLVIASGKFAAVGMHPQPTKEEGEYTLVKSFQSVPLKDALLLVEDPRNWVRKHYTGYRQGNHLTLRLIEQETSGMTLVQCSLMDRRNWSDFELDYALKQLTDVVVDEARAQNALLKELVNALFEKETTRTYIFARYEKEVAFAADDDAELSCELDAETAKLISEIAEDEVENAPDLKQWKRDVSTAALKNLAQKRSEARARQRAATVGRRQKRARLKKTRAAAQKTSNMAKGKRKKDAEAADGPGPRKSKASRAAAAEPAPKAAPKAAAAPPPPPPEDNYTPKTGGTGDWRAFKWGKGWVRWSPVFDKCDAHCRAHPQKPECKLDRALKRGSLALTSLWLKADCTTYEDHLVEKELLSCGDAAVERADERRLLQSLAAAGDENWMALLELERKTRDGEEGEPEMIPCRSVLSTM